MVSRLTSLAISVQADDFHPTSLAAEIPFPIAVLELVLDWYLRASTELLDKFTSCAGLSLHLILGQGLGLYPIE